MTTHPQTQVSPSLSPTGFGTTSPVSPAWPAGISLVAVIAAATVILDVPSPVRPLAVLLFLGFGPGLSVVGLLGIRDLTQRLVLGLGISLALDTVVAGLSIYAGIWSPTGVMWTLVALTFAGAALQFRMMSQPPHVVPFGPLPSGIDADENNGESTTTTATTTLQAAAVSAAHPALADAGSPCALQPAASHSRVLKDQTGFVVATPPVRFTTTVLLLGFIGGCILLIASNARRALR